MGKVFFKKGHFYKVRRYFDERTYAIVCPNEDKEVDDAPFTWASKYIKCIFYITGCGKTSTLCHMRGNYTPSTRVDTTVKPINKRDYIKIQNILKKNNLIYNKRLCKLIEIKGNKKL
jgi:hypothetical protein